MVFYKLRNNKDGTFLTGSRHGYANFTKKGKAFNSIAHIKSSMNPKNSGGKLPSEVTYDDLEVITYQVIEIMADKFKLYL